MKILPIVEHDHHLGSIAIVVSLSLSRARAVRRMIRLFPLASTRRCLNQCDGKRHDLSSNEDVHWNTDEFNWTSEEGFVFLIGDGFSRPMHRGATV